MESLVEGDRVKVVRAVTCTTEVYLGKTGKVSRQGKGFLSAQFFVQLEPSGKEVSFYPNELEKVD